MYEYVARIYRGMVRGAARFNPRYRAARDAALRELKMAREAAEKAKQADATRDAALRELKITREAADEAKQAAERLLSLLYSSGVDHFAEGNLEATEALFECYLKAVGQADLLKDRATNDCPTTQDYAAFELAFRNFLARKRDRWQAGSGQLPEFIRAHAPTKSEFGDIVLSDTKIFFIFPQYIYNSDRHIECDIKDHLYDSALNVGMQADYFFGDHILYPHLGLDPARASAVLATLRERVSTMRPDLIVFDANFMGGDVGINANYLRMLKEEFGSRMIGFMGDVWGTHWIEIANYWGPVVDMVMYIMPDGSFVKACAFSDKMLSSAYPVNRQNYFYDPVKNFDLSFLGSHAYLRPFWLAHAVRAAARLDLKTNIREHERTSDCPSIAEYAEILRRSRMVLNFSSRGIQAKIITGRVWQVLNSGLLLLEEENDQTSHFFEPFVHYVPFENAAQLERLIEFFHKNPDQAKIIGQSALAFCEKHYNATAIWKRMLGAPQLHRSNAGAER